MKTHRFQLAFLDVTLPDMNGLELAARLRQLDPLLRFVIVSGYLSNEAAAVDQAQAEGLIAACISKPFLHEEILRRHRRTWRPARARGRKKPPGERRKTTPIGAPFKFPGGLFRYPDTYYSEFEVAYGWIASGGAQSDHLSLRLMPPNFASGPW
jgi:DNA-binding response OmpR family regulator